METKTNYEKHKAHILKWRQNNPDEYREYQRIYAKEHYENIKEKKKLYYLANKDKKKEMYLRKKELKANIQEFMNILLE